MLKPFRLKSGDKIGIIYPSEPITSKGGLQKGIRAIKSMGFKVVLGKNVFKSYSGYLAGTDKERVYDLNSMFKDKKVRGIFCGHGGFNSNHLLDLIDYKAIMRDPKVFMGFSDITVLLNAIHKKTGLVTFHGQNVEYGFAKGFHGKYRYVKEFFEKAVMKKEPIGSIVSSKKIKVLRPGKAKGRLVGGNLSVLLTLIGTDYEPNWRDKILFWEELKETPQDIDFFLTHMKLRRVFEKISGMVVGKLSKCSFPSGGDIKNKDVLPIEKIILENLKGYKFPIVFGAPFGHLTPQVVLPIGVKSSINTDNYSPFSIDEAAVV